MSDDESHEQSRLLELSINGTPEAQYENRNQPYPKDWKEISAKMLKKRLWSALEAANVLCGLDPSRVSYAPWEGNADDMDESQKYFKDQSDPRTWKLDEVEKKYGIMRQELERVITDGEIEIFEQFNRHDPMSATLDRDVVLDWANQHLEIIPPEFVNHLFPAASSKFNRAVKHVERRDSTWLAMFKIYREEGPEKFLQKDGSLNISRLAKRVKYHQEAFFQTGSHPLSEKTMREQYHNAGINFDLLKKSRLKNS